LPLETKFRQIKNNKVFVLFEDFVKTKFLVFWLFGFFLISNFIQFTMIARREARMIDPNLIIHGWALK
jgi:hypothetical protein